MGTPLIIYMRLRQWQECARIAQQKMRDRKLGQRDRDQATIAFGRALEGIFETLERLDVTPVSRNAADAPTVLDAIEAIFGGMESMDALACAAREVH